MLDNLGHLSLEVARLKRPLVGRKSKKLDPNQLSPMLGAAQADATSAAEAKHAQTHRGSVAGPTLDGFVSHVRKQV